jgi:creatinine amidohydrolase
MKTTLRTRKLEELNWMEFKRLVPKKTDVVLLPIGTIEAHGVTGLGTDNQIPSSIAERIAEPVNALIAPAVNYGITKSLLPYPGSVTVHPTRSSGTCSKSRRAWPTLDSRESSS